MGTTLFFVPFWCLRLRMFSSCRQRMRRRFSKCGACTAWPQARTHSSNARPLLCLSLSLVVYLEFSKRVAGTGGRGRLRPRGLVIIDTRGLGRGRIEREEPDRTSASVWCLPEGAAAYQA